MAVKASSSPIVPETLWSRISLGTGKIEIWLSAGAAIVFSATASANVRLGQNAA